MDSSSMTVVWERSNSCGKWFPYSGEVCQLLEKSFNENVDSVRFGEGDAGQKLHTVHFKDMMEVSEETDTNCQVRRLLFDEDTGIAHQVAWQWEDSDNTWRYYSTEIMNFIENAYKNGHTIIDLSNDFLDYPYMVNFSSMSQKNKETQEQGPILRINVSAYPTLKVQHNVNGDEPHIDIENGHQIDSNTENPQSTSGSSKSKKAALMKMIGNFWNYFKRSFDSDNETGSDSAYASRNIYSPESIHSSAYAIVDGKPWKHPWFPETLDHSRNPVPGIPPLPEIEAVPAPSAADVTLAEFTEEYVLDPMDGNSEEQVCTICYEALTKNSLFDEDISTLIKLKLCPHAFHKSCMRALYESGPKDNRIQCPTCKTIHGVMCGNQPPGKMSYHVLPFSLPGHSDCKTIRIIYDIPPGIQGPEHPNPGVRYSARGFPRHCYLPNNEIGRKILKLLIQAWKRKLIFTIGTSLTTGVPNTVTWNEIHHKTEFGCNYYGHGYPDPNYFDNVIAELAAQGVTESTCL